MASAQKIRIKISGYDHALVDQSAEKIVDTVKRTGAEVSGPIPLPTKKEIITRIVKAAGRINSDSLHKIYPRMTKKNKKLLTV